MRAVIQRVTRAEVRLGEPVGDEPAGTVVGKIGTGLAVLVGVTHDDGPENIERMARKIAQLKLLRNESGDDDPAARVGVEEIGAPVLLISQFTLYADVKKGRKPSWSHAAPGDVALPVFQALAAELRAKGIHVETGSFGNYMEVELVNDGPFTIVAEA